MPRKVENFEIVFDLKAIQTPFSIKETEPISKFPNHHIVIKQEYVDINFFDLSVKRDLSRAATQKSHSIEHNQGAQKNIVLGTCAIGRIVSRGSNVPSFIKEGAFVGYFLSGTGAHSKYRSIDHRIVFGCLEEIDATAIIASFLRGHVAYALLTRIVQIAKNMTVVCGGASGGGSIITAQLAKLKGCKTIGITSSDQKANALKLGTNCYDEIMIANDPNIIERFRDVAPEGAQIILDPVGGNYLSQHLGKMIKKYGIYINYGKNSGTFAQINSGQLYSKSAFFTIPSMFDYRHNREDVEISHMDLMFALKTSLIKPPMGQVFKSTEVNEAFSMMETNSLPYANLLDIRSL